VPLPLKAILESSNAKSRPEAAFAQSRKLRYIARMRVVDRRWIWMAPCILAFAIIMGGIQWLMRGISQEFGMGFAIGAIIASVIVLTAVGWRRGEMTQEAHEREPRNWP
jgi:hypothetical protein